MDRRIQKTLFFCAAIIVMWVTVRVSSNIEVESEALARALVLLLYFSNDPALGHGASDDSVGRRLVHGALWRRTERIMFYAALFFIAAVLTNDLHQKIFAFESLR